MRKCASYVCGHRIWEIAGSSLLSSLAGSLLLLFSDPRESIAAETLYATHTTQDLKKMTLEELMTLEVTTVSRKTESFAQAAAALDVITEEQIRRSGARTLPDILRLAAGVHVARVDGHTWSISARGFNISTANKMQVLMDGRSLYTPLFAGVFWDVQETMLEDIDRIEVIRGPGATMWGANAVNGVINIITKSAKETQGTLVTVGAGTEERLFEGVRYGGRSGNTFYRVYAKGLIADDLVFRNGSESSDDRRMGQTGFRVDSDVSDNNLLTVQGDMYYGEFGQPNSDDNEVGGGNLLGRWTHTFSAESDLRFQFYYDRIHRFIPNTFKEGRNTYDIDAQYRFPLAERHDLVVGLNHRRSDDKIGNSRTIGFIPRERTIQVTSGFVQDEIKVVPDKLGLTLGTKLEYNSFTGFEFQPSGRLIYTPAPKHTLWGAISRAVRTPSRIDDDIRGFTPTGTLLLRGDQGFDSEELLAYELGYRVQPHSKVSFDVAGYYNDYDSLRSQEHPTGGAFPIVLDNKLEGETYGVELAVHFQSADWWRLRASYTHLEKELRLKGDSTDTAGGVGEGNDPANLFTLQSLIDLPRGVQFDCVVRYVDALPNPRVPHYLELDLRVGWQINKNWEVAVVGQNLLDSQHPEFGRQGPTSREVQHSVYGKVTWRF